MVVPTLEDYRFNCYKLLFYKMCEFPHFMKLSVSLLWALTGFGTSS
ncbi:hypothetical protein LEP1GSC115_2903 [Leptospira interrogans serovar Australis str. 200703203]|uniref:Uncharacterized protein n=1 Tax=Leptospira interrogans serovar Australis str. 200703203 TaxID=1085541 RepID=N1UQS0_LEPIR|nr:hypothetical protein LEP1GSC115_2903 [Leptospira interrogans serovar Australis str. 200703203]